MGNPIKSLIGFDKICVKAGGAPLVTFNVETHMESIVSEAGIHTFMVGPSSSYTLQMNIFEGANSSAIGSHG